MEGKGTNRVALIPERGWRVEYRDRTRRELRAWQDIPPEALLEAFFEGWDDMPGIVVQVTETEGGDLVDTLELRESEIALIVNAVTKGVSKSRR